MKKTLALRTMALMMLVALLLVPGMALADSGGAAVPAAQESVTDVVIEQAVAIAGAVLMTAITVAGTWITLQFGKSKKLQNITQATWNAVQLAQQTVPELQADIVDDLKKASEDGKLSKDEIAMITEKLLERTKQKMSAAAYNLLTAAAVDVNALIIGAGKEAVEQMKKQTSPYSA